MRIKNTAYLIYTMNRKDAKKMEDLFFEKYKEKFHYQQSDQKPKFARYSVSLNLNTFYHFHWGNVEWVYKSGSREKLSVKQFLLLRDFYLFEKRKIILEGFKKYLYGIFKEIDKYIPKWYNFRLLEKNVRRIKNYFDKRISVKKCFSTVLRFDGSVLDPRCNWYSENLKNKILKGDKH